MLLSFVLSGCGSGGSKSNDNKDTSTQGALSDVVTTKSDIKDGVEQQTIVFRNFNVGRYKGQLDENTTLLARIFMDLRLSTLPENIQIQIVDKLLSKNKKYFDDALFYQEFVNSSILIENYYISIIEGLRNYAISYIPKEKLKTTQRALKNMLRYYKTDKENLVSIGLMQARATEDKLEFSNYVKTNYGIRPYEIDERTQAFNYSLFDVNTNIIKSVDGGLAGGLYDYFRNKFYFKSEGNEIKYKKLVEDDINFDEIKKLKLEMYKWQGGYPTLLNTAEGLEIVIKALYSSNFKIVDKVKEQFSSVSTSYNKLKDMGLLLDSAINSIDMIIDFFEWIVKSNINQNDKYKVFLEKFEQDRKVIQKLHKQVKVVLKNIDKLFTVKGYDKIKVQDWGEIKKYTGVSKYFDIIPSYKYEDENDKKQDNKFPIKMKELISKNSKKNKIRIIGSFCRGVYKM